MMGSKPMCRVPDALFDVQRLSAPCFCGGTIFITNEVGVSPGPNGPGTLLLTGGRLLR